LEEISSMTKRNSENATNAAALGRQSRDSATAGLDRINELSNTLNTIKSAVGEMQTAVNEMQSSSQQVAKIIKTIDEIAFQTNLLALNAAVEAARAGEAGMGFAVVADEVRALAQRSAQAAKDTADKIEAAVKRSELGAVASTKVVKSLGEVEVTAGSIQQVFTGIVSQIKSLDEVIAEIAAASKEQSQGVGEVNMAVSQMDKVTQSNAAAAEENAASAAELNNQARTLQQLVNQLESVVSGVGAETSAPQQFAAAKPASFKFRAKSATPAAAPVSFTTKTAASKPAAPLKDDFDFPMPEPVGSETPAGSFKDF
jgi:methyl-accepting chemotaxis protein